MSTLPVVVNPVAGGSHSVVPRERLERAASTRGLRLAWWETEGPGHAVELATRAARDRLPMLAVWGGDGTYNEAARGLVDSETALLALPGGTTSVLAYELGVPRAPERALLAQLDGERKAMAVAHTDRGERFLLMLSVGPDSIILKNLPQFLKRHAGKVGITLQAFVEFARARLPRIDVAIDGARRVVSWCIVGNARCYGGPWAGTPGADPFVPGFETVVLNRHGRSAVVPFFFAIPSGAHLKMRGVERFTSQEVALGGAEDTPYQLDGDPAGHLPVTARASAERLWVLVPRHETRGARRE